MYFPPLYPPLYTLLIEGVPPSQKPGVTTTAIKLSYFSVFQDVNIPEDVLDTHDRSCHICKFAKLQ